MEDRGPERTPERLVQLALFSFAVEILDRIAMKTIPDWSYDVNDIIQKHINNFL